MSFDVVAILKLDSKCFFAADSPAGSVRPGEKAWSPKLPLVTAFEICSA